MEGHSGQRDLLSRNRGREGQGLWLGQSAEGLLVAKEDSGDHGGATWILSREGLWLELV